MQQAPSTQKSAFGGLETAEKLSPEQIDARARELLGQLTLDEKIKMMSGDAPFWPGLAEMMGGGYADHPWVAGAVPRLGIPGVRFSDGPRGVVMDGATTFPVSMARGASFDPELEERIGDVIGREIRAMGANHFGGVCINLLRHPAWGRAQESYGEDPYHLGKFGAALARGVQQHVMACVKHYALNSMENARFSVDVNIAPRPLHEIYLRHFQRVVEEGVASVMSAYNSVNGEWCGQNSVLLTEILKEQWGFDGFVLTDFIFGMRDAKKAALAGMDLEMPFAMIFNRDLKALVESNEVPVERVDDAVLRLLRQQIRFAQGRDPQAYSASVVGCQAHRQIARQAAEKSIVLLKNEGGLLPLRDGHRLAVIGKLADTPNTGDGGSSNTRPAYVVTPLQGLREALGEKVKVDYADGSNLEYATRVAKGADMVVLVVGYTHLDEGEYISPDMMVTFASGFPQPSPEEMPFVQALMQSTSLQDIHTYPPGGDRKMLTLHPADEALIQAVAAVNDRVVVAIMAGSAVITEAWRAQVPAILMLWYPGMEGGHAFADLLLGRVNPSGRLPCVFPKRAEDLPNYEINATTITYDLWHGYRKLERDGVAPAFPFGFGLSYTTYRYSNFQLEQPLLGQHDVLTARLDVTNTGSLAGEEVVQFYVAAHGSRVERAPKELKAFTRLALQPGQTKTVRVEIPVQELAYYDEQQGWTVENLKYELIAAQHSLDKHALRATFEVI